MSPRRTVDSLESELAAVETGDDADGLLADADGKVLFGGTGTSGVPELAQRVRQVYTTDDETSGPFMWGRYPEEYRHAFGACGFSVRVVDTTSSYYLARVEHPDEPPVSDVDEWDVELTIRSTLSNRG